MIVFEIIGMMTVLYFASYFILYLLLRISAILKEQRKIKCLCKHEYIIDYKWYNDIFEDLSLRCRKCGKKRKIRIWKSGESIGR